MGNFEVLKRINEDIRKLEIFMEEYPVTDGMPHYFPGHIELCFCVKTKRILMSVESSNSKNLIEWDVKNRVACYQFLPQFLEMVIEDEKEFINEEEIVKIAKKLQLAMRK